MSEHPDFETRFKRTQGITRTSVADIVLQVNRGKRPEGFFTDDELKQLGPLREKPSDYIPEKFKNGAWRSMSDAEFFAIVKENPDFEKRMYQYLCATEASPAWLLAELEREQFPLRFFSWEEKFELTRK